MASLSLSKVVLSTRSFHWYDVRLNLHPTVLEIIWDPCFRKINVPYLSPYLLCDLMSLGPEAGLWDSTSSYVRAGWCVGYQLGTWAPRDMRPRDSNTTQSKTGIGETVE